VTLFNRLINHVRDTYVTVRQFNTRPRPRCIALGFNSQGLAALEQALPGIVRISSLDDVHQTEWDLLVAAGADLVNAESHLFVIAFGCRIIGKIHADDAVLLVRTYEIDEEKGPGRSASVAVEFNTPDPIPPRFVPLVADDLVPRLKAEHRHDTLMAYRPSGGDVGKPSYDVPGVERMLVGSDGAVYAAHFKRPGGKSWFLTLPDDANVVAWVEAAVSHWHGVDAKRFPGTLDWTNQAYEWMTSEEDEAARAALAAGEAKERAEADEKAAWDRFREAREVARSGPLRLLTEQGEALSAAVRDALREIGLVVRDMDEEHPGDDLLEDLRASPLDRPEWVALVEVKGYMRSLGKAEDLLNLTGRFGRRFRTAEGRDPDAYWYIVNHEMGTDPTARRQILGGSDSEVESFGSIGGLAIDTVDLFRLWRDVTRGDLSQTDAQGLLVGATGRLAYEPVGKSRSLPDDA
jgi:hypothetical protein